MTSLWKPRLWSTDQLCIQTANQRYTSSFQLEEVIFLYNGMSYQSTRLRLPFLQRKWNYFIRSQVRGRPIRTKFRLLSQKKKKK